MFVACVGGGDSSTTIAPGGIPSIWIVSMRIFGSEYQTRNMLPRPVPAPNSVDCDPGPKRDPRRLARDNRGATLAAVSAEPAS